MRVESIVSLIVSLLIVFTFIIGILVKKGERKQHIKIFKIPFTSSNVIEIALINNLVDFMKDNKIITFNTIRNEENKEYIITVIYE